MSMPLVGREESLKRILGLSVSATPYVQVGSGTNAESDSDTALQTELARALASVVTVSGQTANIRAFFNTAQGNGTIAETGINTAASGGIQLDRSLESPAQTKTSAQELIVEYAITLERG